VKKIYLYLILSVNLAPISALAEGISIEPGKWEITTTITIPILPQPRVTTKTECMKERELSPETMTDDDTDSDCTLNTVVVDGNTMKWSMDCQGKEGNSRGEWEVTSRGDTLTGEGKVTVDVQEQDMVMTMNWEGKRIGDCD